MRRCWGLSSSTKNSSRESEGDSTEGTDLRKFILGWPADGGVWVVRRHDSILEYERCLAIGIYSTYSTERKESYEGLQRRLRGAEDMEGVCRV
jgi:hypothetical protein